jgi:putative DNA primase/helicase
MTPDLEQARTFLQLLDPEASMFTLQTADDTPAKRKILAGVRHMDPANGGLYSLAKENLNRAGIFVTVNETDGRGRETHNIVRVRALVADLDGPPLEPVLSAPLSPHIVVETSPGHYHAYWLCDDCPLEQFGPAQLALAAKFGGDTQVHDLPRVMRLPGFIHYKGEPFQSRLLHDLCHQQAPYDFAEIVAALQLDMQGAASASQRAGAGTAEKTLFVDDEQVAELRSALCAIRADDRDLWVRMGHALKTIGDRGRALWLEWSQTSEKFDPRDAASKWDSFRPTETDYRAVFAEAQRCGWVNPRKKRAGGSERAAGDANAADESEPEDEAASAPGGDSGATLVNLVRGDAVTARAIDWLWKGYLARGKMHVVAGAPSTGKTTLALKCGATVTQGGRWPDGSRAECGDVLIWSGEDSIEDTLVPRLLAMDADMSRVHFVGNVREGRGVVPFDPAKHFPALVSAASRLPELRLMIVDPIVSAVSGDSHKNAEVRRGLAPLVAFAERVGCALLGVTHFTKGTQGREPVERITGSLGFGAVTRIAFATAKLPAEEGGGRVLVRAKSNIGEEGNGFRYEVVPVELAGCTGITATRIEWGEPIEGSAREILANAEVPEDDAGGDPKKYLRSLLLDGPMDAAEVLKDARANGFSKDQMYRARRALGVQARKGGMRGGWRWFLPEAPEDCEDREDCEDCAPEESQSSARSSPPPSEPNGSRSAEDRAEDREDREQEKPQSSQSSAESATFDPAGETF